MKRFFVAAAVCLTLGFAAASAQAGNYIHGGHAHNSHVHYANNTHVHSNQHLHYAPSHVHVPTSHVHVPAYAPVYQTPVNYGHQHYNLYPAPATQYNYAPHCHTNYTHGNW